MASASAIISACAIAFGVDESVLRSPCRKRPIARTRQAAIWMLRTFPTPMGAERSFPQIAGLLGRDHTSMIHGYQVAENLMARDELFAAKLADACDLVGKVVPMNPLSPADLPPDVRLTVDPREFRHVKPRNERAQNDADGRMRLHGTFALGRALIAAGGHR